MKYKKFNRARVKEKLYNENTGQLYLNLEYQKNKKAIFWFESAGKEDVSEGDFIKYIATSIVDVESTENIEKRIILGPDNKSAINFIGEVIDETDDKLVVDAGINVYVDKNEEVGIGDYVTGQWPSEIRGYLEKELNKGSEDKE